jgi:uncharacterized MAPEG superfamily protein
MSLALWCVLVVGILPVLTTGFAKALGARMGGRRFDNANPRGWQQQQSGMAARAHAAHLNGFEAFPLFAAAVLVAETRGVPAGMLGTLAIAYVASRIAFIAMYLADFASARSVVWAIGFFLAIGIFTMPVWSR